MNKIVEFLLNSCPFTFGQIALMGFDYTDWQEFAKLVDRDVDSYAEDEEIILLTEESKIDERTEI